MMGLSIAHWVIVAGVLTVLFGSSRIVPTMKDLGKSMRELKKLPDAISGDLKDDDDA